MALAASGASWSDGLRITSSQASQPMARTEGSVLVQGLHKWFGTFEVLQGIDFQVAPGEVVVIVGPSGSGKTTLLRCINFLEEYQSGRILVGGKLIGYREHAGKLIRLPDREQARDRAD